MGSKTGISWTDATWNPWQGCTKVSEGCRNCYMVREKERYGQDPFKVVRSSPVTFNAPLTWARTGKLPEGSRIFVCSWSDFFHPAADEWRREAWEIMWRLPQYKFLIPTKRLEQITNPWPPDYPNIWLGASVENQKTANERIPQLLRISAAVRWLSVEPMLGPVDLSKILITTKFYFPGDEAIDLWQLPNPISWVVIGGESGPKCRPTELKWVRDLLDQCKQAGIAVYIKQFGGWPNTRHELSDFPEDLRVREFPR